MNFRSLAIVTCSLLMGICLGVSLSSFDAGWWKTGLIYAADTLIMATCVRLALRLPRQAYPNHEEGRP